MVCRPTFPSRIWVCHIRLSQRGFGGPSTLCRVWCFLLAFEANIPPLISFIFLRQSFILELWVWEKSVLRTTPPNLECGGLNLHPQDRTCAAHRNRDRSWRALQHRSILFFFLPPGATPRSRRRRTERSQCRRTATSGCARGLGAKVVRNARCGCDACIRGFPA